MGSIVGVRGDGDRPAVEDITDPLLSMPNALIERARTELNRRAAMGDGSFVLRHQGDIRAGELVLVSLADLGETFAVSVRAFEHVDINGAGAETTIEVLRPVDVAE